MAGYIETAKRKDYETPQALFFRLDEVFHFTLDAACDERNKKCKHGITSGSLCKYWPGRVFVNPPYGDGLDLWIKKAAEAVEYCLRTELVVMFISSSTETAAWQDYVMEYAHYIIYKRGRTRHEISGELQGPAGKGQAIVVFSKKDIPNIYSLSDIGKVRDQWKFRQEAV